MTEQEIIKLLIASYVVYSIIIYLYVSYRITSGEIGVPRYKNPPKPPVKKPTKGMFIRYEYTDGITPDCDGWHFGDTTEPRPKR
jgi:hypothetical protein